MKTVIVMSGNDPGVLQPLYCNPREPLLLPNLCAVDADGRMVWETNGVGLRGPDVQPGVSVAVVWGDSVVFGLHVPGWPEMLNGYGSRWLFLNGGLEGIDYSTVLHRAASYNRSLRIDMNILMPGWHFVGHNARFGEDLLDAVGTLPNPVLLTMPTSLNGDMIDTDIAHLVRYEFDNPLGYGFWSENYSIARQREMFEHIVERNATIKKVAALTKTPVIDLFEAMDSSRLADFREYFFDPSHPRPSAYRKLADTVWSGIESQVSG